MTYHFPTPKEVNINIPPYLREELFDAGFDHALRGRHLTRSEHLRRSFRAGFRAAKLYLREVRRAQGIVQFPMRGRIRVRAMGMPRSATR